MVEVIKHKEGYKETKFGLIPEGWTTPAVGEVFDFLKTTSFSRNQLNYEERNKLFYLHYGDIHSTYLRPILDFENENRVPRLNEDLELPKSVQFLKNGDLVVADASEDYEGVGQAVELFNLNGNKAISGLHTFALRDKANLTVEGFRAYIFKNLAVKKELKKIATGSNVYGVSKGNLQKFKIVLPTREEQQKIAQILSTCDIAITKQEKLIKQKQQLKKGLMQKLLTGEKRFPKFNDEWEELKIGEAFKIVAGKDLQKSNFSLVKSDETFYPLYSNSLSNKGLYGYYNYYQFEGDKITVTARGSLGKATPQYERFNAMGRLLVLSAKFELSIKFVSEYINNILKIFVESTGVPQLTAPQFSSYKIKLPRIDEQKKIALVLTAADKEIEKLQKQLVQLKKQKQGLVQQLLTGKIRVKV